MINRKKMREEIEKDFSKNPRLAESMRKAKKKHYRRRMEIAQIILLAFAIAILSATVAIPAAIKESHEAIPYLIVVLGMVAHALYYIVCKLSIQVTRDNEVLFWAKGGKHADSHRCITGTILKSSHQNTAFVFLIFSWLGILAWILKFEDQSMNAIQAALAAVSLFAHMFLSVGNIYLGRNADEQYIENLKSRNK